MLNKLLSYLWINHPRAGEPDAMLTLAVYATMAAIIKFLINEAVFTFNGMSVNCGKVDSLIIAALLTPTLGAYVTRKMKDSPDAE